MRIHHLMLLLSLVFLPGCGIIDAYFLPPPEDTALELFENGNDAMRDKNYREAAESYGKLKDNFPFSPYTVDAELAFADALYLDEEYLEASDAYKDFESLHPRHESIPYVLYQIGMSEMKSFVSIDRPTTMVQEAIQYFNRLIETYPNTEYAQNAPEQIVASRTIIAEHELYLGDTYWHMEQYGPAWRRYTYVVDNFPDVPKVAEHAKEKALAAYYKYRETESADNREEVEGSIRRDWFHWL